VNHPKGFRTEDFDVRIEERRVCCPAQKQSTQCGRLEQKKTRKAMPT